MTENFFQSLPLQLAGWLSGILSLAGLRQVGAFVIVLVVAWPFEKLLQRFLNTVQDRFARIPWLRRFFQVVEASLLPFVAWVLGRIALGVFRDAGWEQGILDWAVPFLALWLIYRVLAAVVSVNMPAEQARVWSREIVLPIILFVAVLHGAGLLDRILQWGLSLPDGLHITVGSLVGALAVVAVFFAFSRGARQFLGRVFLPRAGLEPALTQAVSAVIAYAVIVLGVLMALNVMGIPLTTLAVVAGGLSVGVGFGLQEIVSNFVSGFILMFERSIGPGDVVEVGNDTGVVQTVGIRSMIIKTRDNIELVVPNSRFMTETVTNFTRADPIVRVKIGVGVSYDANPREVEQALLEAAQHSRILDEPAPAVRFREFADSSLNFDLLVWTKDAARLPGLTSDLRYRIWDALAARNIEIPFPQRDIHIRSSVMSLSGPADQG